VGPAKCRYIIKSQNDSNVLQPIQHVQLEITHGEAEKLPKPDAKLIKPKFVTDSLDKNSSSAFSTQSEKCERYESKIDLTDAFATTVNPENHLRFVELYSKWRMISSVEPQIRALLSGLYYIIPKPYLRIFNEKEFESILNGSTIIDIDDWRAFSRYTGFSTSDPIVRWFWEIVGDMSNTERRMLIQYTTSSSSLPVQGFEALVPKFNISRYDDAPTDYLPCASYHLDLRHLFMQVRDNHEK